MRRILQRPAIAFVLGGLVIGAAFAGTAAYAKITAPTANTITACYKPNGEVTLIGLETKRDACKKNEIEVEWNVVGPRGATGAQGAKGDPGAAGSIGAKGDTGAPGAKGDTGAPGAPGAPGAKGDTGATGAPGAPGAKGDTGPQGAVGPQGPAGPQGTAGSGSGSGFSGSFTSPNGLYSLAVTDAGITLKGPGGKVVIDRSLVRVIGEPWISIEGQGR